MPKNKYKGRSITASSYQPVHQQQSYVSTANRVRATAVTVSAQPSIAQKSHPSPEVFPSFSDDPYPLESSLCSPIPFPPKSETAPGNVKVKAKAKRYLDSDAPLLAWKDSYREEYLDNALGTEGRGRLYNGKCSSCGAAEPRFRCRDCFGLRMYCKLCLLHRHQDQPLHYIQEWTKEQYFRPRTLRELGYRIQLGHPPGEECDSPVSGHKDFVVLAWNGIHVVDLDFCGCPDAPEHRTQLMEIGWWPTSYKDPQSAATFKLLRNFHITNLQGQLPPTDFYHVLEQMVDGSGLSKIPDRLAQFMLVIREWRHIKMTKRCGRGHDPTGIAGTPQGGAAVLCRACPMDGINIPPQWWTDSADRQWLYTLILAMDANFKQKARARANDHQDPALGPGFGCTVNHETYLKEIQTRAQEQGDEISHCVAFNAIWAANTKKSKGLRATGIGSVSCARHGLFRPNGTGDLQKGERQINMDWLFLSAIMWCNLILMVISYDIACQWMINFFVRMAKLPAQMKMPTWRVLKFKVPKFHLPAHKDQCYARFAFNFTEGVGMTDGEAPERNWSVLNVAASSLAMMSFGGRLDTMDDHCNFGNWRKTVQLDNSLLKKLVKSITEAVVYWRSYSAFNDALMIDHADLIEKWKVQLGEWERDHTKPCPYDLPASAITLAKVKKHLAEEDLKREREGKNTADSTLSGLVIEGLEIEEAQYNLQAIADKSKSTVIEETSIQKRRTNLLRRIRNYRKMQVTHMPGLQSFLDAVDADTSIQPEKIPVLLPSSPAFDDKARQTFCSSDLINIEIQLREGQAFDSLGELRAKLRARSVASKHKSKLIQSQGMYTRQRTLEDQISGKIEACQQLYTTARNALLQLKGPGEWTRVLQPLKREDIRGINERLMRDEEKAAFREAQERAGVGQEEINRVLDGVCEPTVPVNPVLDRGDSKCSISWIWYTLSLAGKSSEEVAAREGASVEEIEASLRVEWCKARARARRAREELILVDEEMRRSIEFCQWRSKWWLTQVGRRNNISPWVQEGIMAYAIKQAAMERRRAELWAQRWNAVRSRAREVRESLDDPERTLDCLTKLQELVVEIEVDDTVGGGDSTKDDDIA